MFKKEVCLKYRRESKQRLKFKEDYRATRDYIIRACEYTWWDWVGGSRLFSRWSRKNWAAVRDCRSNFVYKSLPSNSVP